VRPFAYDAIGGRVVFGAGARRQLPAELDALGARRVLVVASPDEDALADDVTALVGERVVGRFRDVV
jgi:maleylacetate reductase